MHKLFSISEPAMTGTFRQLFGFVQNWLVIIIGTASYTQEGVFHRKRIPSHKLFVGQRSKLYLTSPNIKIKMTNTQVANNSCGLEWENRRSQRIDKSFIFLKLNCGWSNIFCFYLFKVAF